MGFATGLRAGSGLVQSVIDNERQARLDARATDEYDYKVKERKAVDDAVGKVEFPGGLQTPSPAAPVVAGGLPSPKPESEAPPASVAATGGSGLPPVASGGGLPNPAPVVPGGGGLPTPSPVAAPPAAPPVSGEKKLAASMFEVAKAKKDVNGMNAAVEQFHTASRNEIVNDSAKLSDDDAYKYLHENVNKVGSLPMSIVKEGKGGYRVTAWSEDGGKGASALLSSSDVKKLVAADKMMKGGYGAQGMELAGSVNKDLNNVIKDYNTETNQQVATGNTATHYGNTEAETSRHNKAAEGNAAAHLGLARNKAEMDKFQNGTYWTDPKTNEQYITVPQTGKGGLQMQAFKVSGEGSMQPVKALPAGLTKVGGSAGKAGTAKEIPAAGTMMEGADGTYQSDGKGGRISVNAPLPAERANVLKKLGLSGGEAGKVTWTGDGEHVTFPGANVGYNVNDSADMAQMKQDMNEASVQRTMGTETAARVAGAPGRRAAREQHMSNLSDPNRFGPGVGLPMNVPQDRRDLYVNTDE